MDTRKIQTVGGGTYTVSLPKEWAKSQGIDTGDAVNIHTHIDGVLVIQAGKQENDAPDQVTIQVTDDDLAPLERTLRAAYAVGANEVTFEAAERFTTDQQRTVNRVARNLTGASVVSESERRLTVQTLLDTGEVSVRQSVRQLKFVALSMHRDATAMVTTGAQSDGLADRDDQADRLHAMIDRSFSQALTRLDAVDALGIPRLELFELWATTRELERVADHAEGIALTATDPSKTLDEQASEEVEGIARDARDVVEDAVRVVLRDASVEAARRALATRNQVRQAITAMERQTADSGVERSLRPVLERLRRTAEHGGNIAELGVRNAILRGTLAEPTEDTDDNATREAQPFTGE